MKTLIGFGVMFCLGVVPVSASQVSQEVSWQTLSGLEYDTGEVTEAIRNIQDQTIQITGFIVPLEMDDYVDRVSEFVLVPDPLSCIHVPPPPPNQIILVDYPDGIVIDDIYQAFWVQGTLRVSQSSNELADASYALSAERVWLYDGQ